MKWNTELAIDFDRWAALTYKANFPDVRVECASVGDSMSLLKEGMSSILTGGPPCQPHSHAGKRGASKDTRDCGPDFVAAIGKVHPRMFLMENVPGLLTSEGGQYFQRMYAAMEGQGYVVQYRVQNAVDFGVPQFRSRLWVWGIRRDLYVDGIRHLWPVHTHAWPPPEMNVLFGVPLLPGVTVGEALGIEWWATECNTSSGMSKVPRTGRQPSTTVCGSGNTMGGLLAIEDPKHPINHPHLPAVTQRSGGGDHSPPNHTILLSVDGRTWESRHPIPSPNEPMPTIRARSPRDGGRCTEQVVRIGMKVRRLTPLECMRLQSAPDDFRWPEKISKTAMYKICGNGWASGHGAAFSTALAKSDPDSRTVIDLFCGGGLGACGWHGRYWSHEMQTAGVA